MPSTLTRRGVVYVLAAAAGLEVAGLALLGLPGALLLEMTEPLIRLLWGIPAGTPIMKGDAYWPMAILATVLFPVALVLSYVGASKAGLLGRERAVAMLAGTLVGAVVGTMLVYAVGVN